MNSPSLNPLQVQQLLHGYDGGHRLLAGSRELPAPAARRILTLSDLSGTIPPRGFESYITAYPVREIGCYAFARTWYAPEMPRPGCVWTHTFLLEIPSLEKVNDLRQLGKLFRRPVAGKVDESYARPIDLSPPGVVMPLLADYPPLVTREFLRAFYGEASSPIVLLESMSSSSEDLLLEAWAQLWPASRADLTISSGSLSPRKIDGRPFDLQITPPGIAREVVRSASALLIDGESEVTSLGDEEWVVPVQEDFVTHGRLGLREFLARVGDDSLRRSDVPGIARVFARMRSSLEWSMTNLTDLFQAIAENFPEPDRATALKAFGLRLGDEANEPQFFRLALRELASSDYGSAFSSPALGLEKKAHQLLAERPEEAMGLLFGLLQHSLNPFGEQVVKGLISGLQESQAISFLRDRPQLVSTIVRLRPLLATNPQLWRDLGYHTHEILAAVAASAEMTPEILQKIFPVLFSAGLDYQASYFVDLFGTAAVRAIFAHRGPLPANLHDRWLDALASRPALILSYLNDSEWISRESLSGVAAILAPENAMSPLFPLARWTEAVQKWEPSFSPSQDAVVEICAFSLALAFRQRTEDSVELAVLSFETVHAAGLVEKIPPVAWVNLEPLLPRISLFRDWDRCERLRRALLAMYGDEIWPIQSFGRVLHNPATFASVMQTAAELSMGRTVIALIEKAMPEKTNSFTEQQKILTHDLAGQTSQSKKGVPKHGSSKRIDK